MNDFNDGKYEVVTDNSDVDVKIYLSEEAAGFVPPHWHRHIEVVLVLNGEVVFSYEGKDVILHSNEFIVIDSGVLHASKNTDNKSIVLQIPVSLLEKYWTTPEMLDFNITKVDGEYNEVVQNLKELLNIYTLKETGYRLKFNEKLMRCLYNILKNYSKTKVQMNVVEDLKLKELLTYVNKEYATKISVHGLAERFHFHPDYLSRYFKKKTNLALSRYIYLVRLSHVHHDILTTDNKINTIFLNNGITNTRLAIKIFEECYGVLPRQLRK